MGSANGRVGVVTRSVLFVHAHPDDESLGTGATMAKYAAEGARVTLVTCTLGEEGEIAIPELAHLASDREDRLGEHRLGELAEAAKLLGVSDRYQLGGVGRWRDSGMMGARTNNRPDCFWRADLDAAARALTAVIGEVRPQVLVTYDENGVYGHPDHIQAYRVAARAFELVRGTRDEIQKFYLATIPRSMIAALTGALRGVDDGLEMRPEVATFGVPDERMTTLIDGRDFLQDKLDALRAHASQVAIHAPWFTLPAEVAKQVLGIEQYVLRDAAPGLRETDLLADLPR